MSTLHYANIYLIILLLILVALCVFLLWKLNFIKKSIKKIVVSLNEIANSDTNNILTVSTSNKEIRLLANQLNKELKSLRKQRLQYENGNQELKKTITNISHDMRTPLTAINGYIDFIKENNNKEKQQEYINIIQRKTKNLIDLTENLFDFSKTLDIGTKIKKEKCLLNEILEETLANYYIIFKENNITPNVQICENKIYKSIDKLSITRVLENIISNIIKYSKGDFTVILDENGKISFSNTATSLDATTVKKIFDRYYTIENAKKSTGVGLSIAKQLVELNGGNINGKYVKGKLIIEIEL